MDHRPLPRCGTLDRGAGGGAAARTRPRGAGRRERALVTQQPTSFEEYYQGFDAWFETDVYPSREGVSLFLRDVTLRKRAEAALLESEARKTGILEAALFAIITIDHQGRVVEFNPAAETIFGYPRDEVIGREMAELIIPPSLRDRHHRGLQRYLTSGEGPILGRRLEMPALRADGSEFPVELAIVPLRTQGPPMFTGFAREITEQKRLEEERALHQAQLASRAGALARSNEELQRFAYVASHDLQEPLRAVATYTELLRQRYQGKLDAEADEFILFAVDGAKRMHEMIQDLLAYSGVGQEEVFEEVDSGVVLQEVLQNLKVAIEEKKACVTQQPLPVVRADRTRLAQLFQT